MGIKKILIDSIKSTISDQWIDVYTVGEFSEQTVVLPGVKKDKNNIVFRGIITNGSRIYVPDNTAVVIFDQSGVEDIITESGVYYYNKGKDSLFSWGTIKESIVDETLDRFRHAGTTPDEKRISFINLREIRNIQFGTRSPLLYHDSFYDVDLEIMAYGSFTIRIIDPYTFVKNYLPANTQIYSFDDIYAKEQLVAELSQSFVAALGSLSKQYRISDMPARINEVSAYISEDPQYAGSWPIRFGLKLVKNAIENFELSDASKDIVKMYATNRMKVSAFEGVSQQAADIAAQQKIAQGIRERGFGDVGGTILGVYAAQELIKNGGKNGTESPEQLKSMSIDEQVESLRKMKELLDEGILSQEEYEKKKKQILQL